MKKHLLFWASALLFIACKNESKTEQLKDDGGRGAAIIDTVVQKAGSDRFEASTIDFNFRGTYYKSNRNCGQYELQRIEINKDNDTIVDVVDNSGFTQTLNGEEVSLADSTKTKYANSVNAVHYFVELPFGLNDPMVKKYFVGETTIQNKTFYIVEVTFDQELTGKEHEDDYLYWINKTTYAIDYLAYKYGKEEEKGIRFREAYNPRNIEGIRFVDYKNYKPKDNNTKLEELDNLFEKQALEFVSDIKTTEIRVNLKKKNCI